MLLLFRYMVELGLLLLLAGVGGNLVAVHASRASTYLHRHGIPGQAPSNMSVGCGMNCATFLCDKCQSFIVVMEDFCSSYYYYLCYYPLCLIIVLIIVDQTFMKMTTWIMPVFI